jgi:hypothetical protein
VGDTFHSWLVSGLSATIGEPEKFNKWLESVQTAHGYKHSFIVHPHRYSHLRKYVYVMDKNSTVSFAGLDLHTDTGQARFVHPISALAFGARGLPADLALESRDALTLYDAFVRHQDKLPNRDISSLKPTKFFENQKGFLTQLDIINYESALKEVLLKTMAGDAEGGGEALPEIIGSVNDRTLSVLSSGHLNSTPNKELFKGQSHFHYRSEYTQAQRPHQTISSISCRIFTRTAIWSVEEPSTYLILMSPLPLARNPLLV